MDKKYYIIDRFEGEYAVCEYADEMRNIARVKLPKNAKSGDCLVEHDGKFAVDYQMTEQRRKEICDLQDKLFK